MMQSMGKGARRIARHYIGAWMTKKGMTQARMAGELGVSSAYMSTVFNGKKTPSVRLCLEISRILKIHMEELFNKPPH